jgi:hypothetical protein
MSKCAYCPSTGPFTKEHIWPRALIQKYDDLRTYNPKSNKFYSGEPAYNSTRDRYAKFATENLTVAAARIEQSKQQDNVIRLSRLRHGAQMTKGYAHA